MNYQQMALAINNLDELEIKLRESGEWYATTGMEIKDGGVLKSCMGNGSTPEEAVIALWDELTDIPTDQYLVKHAYADRKAYRWTGFMWAVVHEPKAAA